MSHGQAAVAAAAVADKQAAASSGAAGKSFTEVAAEGGKAALWTGLAAGLSQQGAAAAASSADAREASSSANEGRQSPSAVTEIAAKSSKKCRLGCRH